MHHPPDTSRDDEARSQSERVFDVT